MPAPFSLKPTSKAVGSYYVALAQLANVGARHETAVRSAFEALIDAVAGPRGWTLVREYELRRKGAASLRIDGSLVDDYRLTHGFFEAKDDADDLAAEMGAKLKLGYPQDNILFWQPRRIIVFQNGSVALDTAKTDPTLEDRALLLRALELFFSYQPPAYVDWERAVSEFSDRVPELAKSVLEVIRGERIARNKKFAAAFDDFTQLCRTAINPNLAVEAVEEMLIQHLLTERLFHTVFANPDFVRRNVIAAEIEKVIDALASRAFSRAAFLQKLDRFYLAIEGAAATIADWSEKQKFLNTVYEKFFQGFAVKVADTMGIVYTPPSIVRFMIASIREILRREFDRELHAPGVHFLDPFTGTGNFLVHLMREFPRTALPRKYAGEMWANEIMLLPYYIACLNVEHAYFEATGAYEPFPGLCLVDTFELAEPHDAEFEFMTAANTDRVNRQKKAPIFVVLGNPPYNANQQDENDNNKNRKYPHLDQRVKRTFAADSKATLLNKLRDPYIKALRWASDRIGEEGIVAYVTNSGYLDAINADGVRQHLAADFDAIYLVDLGGNVRKNPKLSGTTHNVFGIQVGVSIAFFVRHRQKKPGPRRAAIRYAAAGGDWRKERKWAWLDECGHIDRVKWRKLVPDKKHNWLCEGLSDDFDDFLPLGSKAAKALDSLDAHAIFRTYSLGISTNRDSVVYDFDRERLSGRVREFCAAYHGEIARWQQNGRPEDVDGFVRTESVKWSRDLKEEFRAERKLEFEEARIRTAQYRPFSRRHLYLAKGIVDRLGLDSFPSKDAFAENLVLSLTGSAPEKPFMTLVLKAAADLHLSGAGTGCQCFPLYTYAEDGSHRRDNVTDWALEQFRARYPKANVTKRDIFHYVYAVLHHPAYREKYAANLRRELPRIPFAPDFRGFVEAGEKLAALHVGYDKQTEFPLRRVETPGTPLDLRVERMKLSKDRSSLRYNGFLTLEGIPPEVHDYRLGNRSALDWIVDQYRVERTKDGTVTSDPNRDDDPDAILRLIGQVVTVSVETMAIVRTLPTLA